MMRPFSMPTPERRVAWALIAYRAAVLLALAYIAWKVTP